MTFTLASGQVVEGDTEKIGILKNRFMSWAETVGISNYEALAMICYDNIARQISYFESAERANRIALNGFDKLGDKEVPRLLQMDFRSEVINISYTL